MTSTSKPPGPRSEPPLPEDDLAIGHREIATAALVWLLFGLLNAVADHGAIAVGLHLAASVATLGCAVVAHRGHPVLAFHVAASVWVLVVTTFSLITGTLVDGSLTLVLVPVLATYVSSAYAGLSWLAIVTAALALSRWALAAHWIAPLFEPTPALREPTLVALGAVMWLFAERSRRRSDLAFDRLRRVAIEARTRADDLARLKLQLEEKNEQLDQVAERLAESAKEVAEINVALEEARDAALHRAKEAGDFLTRMSHEIRTPLNGVLGITDVLLAGKLDRETRDLVTIIESSGRVLRRLVDEVLDLARLDAGKLQLVEEPFDPLTVAEDVVDLFAAQAAAKGVLLVTIAPEEASSRLLGDAMRVRQVLQNLVGNAVKFTTRGHVRVDVSIDRERIGYRVEDTGPGLSEEALGTLFSEYAQEREGARRGGSGLGLVIARRLARAMGGDVTVESRVGEGSVFTATFALSRASTGRGVPSAEELSGTMMSVGLVSDAPLLELALTRTAMHVNMTVTRLEKGIAPTLARPLAVVFTDGPPVPGLPKTPLVRMRFPSDEHRDDDGLVLLLPPRRTRLVRVTRQATGRVREPTQNRPVAAPKGLAALVIDDEPVNRKVASLLLTRAGWTVTSAESGAQALEALSDDVRIDAVLLDLDMPGMNGIETAMEITRRVPFARRPWLVLQTASVSEEARSNARRAGVVDFLPKPFEAEQLEAVILRAERHRRLQDRRAQRGVTQAGHDPATHAAVVLLAPVAEALVLGETDVALAQLGELQALARRRQLDRIDRCCSALHDALLESEGLDACVELEEAVWAYAREASTDHGIFEI
ncbi:MAG: response regulator [Sandaracinaceae bacterium]|nr:response regulator [Sandaracinaceae bacterium]